MRQPPSHDPIRRALVRAAAALAAAESFQLPAWSAKDPTVLPPSIGAKRDQIVLPLYCMGSAVITAPRPTHETRSRKGAACSQAPVRPRSQFCTEYYIDGRRFRAVVDTGSPFMLVDGSVTASNERWGRFPVDDSPLSVPLDDVSYEMFGGQDVDVEWRRGSLRLAGYSNLLQQNAWLGDRLQGARSGPWTSPSPMDVMYEPMNFGVVRTYQGRGGGGAIYLGLAKDRQPSRIRPTFLEQTDLSSMRFDFLGRTLTLARRPLLNTRTDAIPLVDLRPLGAPLASYAVKAHRLLANGQELDLKRPVYAIIDTGTTGLVIGDTLYDSDEFPLPGAAVRKMEVEVLTEAGKVVTLSAGRRRRRLDEVGLQAGLTTLASASSAGGPAQSPLQPSPFAESFPLITTPVKLDWFAKKKLPPGEEAPHVICLGLAFLSRLQLTIDADEMRMATKVLDV